MPGLGGAGLPRHVYIYIYIYYTWVRGGRDLHAHFLLRQGVDRLYQALQIFTEWVEFSNSRILRVINIIFNMNIIEYNEY